MSGIWTLGIDPGLTGGIVLLHSGRPVASNAMPTEVKKSGKRRVDCFSLDACVDSYLKVAGASIHVVLEEVGAMPGQGSVSGFGFGESYGAARLFATIVAARSGGSLTLARPNEWKAAMKLAVGKGAKAKVLKAHAMAVAQARWPGHTQIYRGDGLAEAALLAAFLYERLTGTGHSFQPAA